MSATFRANTAVATIGDATGSSVTVTRTPALPTGTLVGDRVFTTGVATAALSLTTNAAGWNVLLASTSLGGGTMGASVGPRFHAVWWKDYDGVWSMPTIQSAAMAQNSIAAFSFSVQKTAQETFDTPTVVTGSMTTGSTAMSIASAAAVWATGLFLWMVDGFPSTTTATSPNVTASGVTFGTKTIAPTSTGTTNGNDAAMTGSYCSVTTGSGSSVAATHTATLGTARTAGCAFVRQNTTAIPPKSPPPPNPWRRRNFMLVR